MTDIRERHVEVICEDCGQAVVAHADCPDGNGLLISPDLDKAEAALWLRDEAIVVLREQGHKAEAALAEVMKWVEHNVGCDGRLDSFSFLQGGQCIQDGCALYDFGYLNRALRLGYCFQLFADHH